MKFHFNINFNNAAEPFVAVSVQGRLVAVNDVFFVIPNYWNVAELAGRWSPTTLTLGSCSDARF